MSSYIQGRRFLLPQFYGIHFTIIKIVLQRFCYSCGSVDQESNLPLLFILMPEHMACVF